MAKYRITSIPQYAPGGETNWPPDWMKRKKKKLNSVTESATNYRPTSEEIMVQGVDPQNIWSGINPTNVPTAEQFPTYDIGPQDYGRKRSGLEQYETLPIIGNQQYGFKKNRYTGKLEKLPAGEYQDQYGKTGNVEVNRYIDLDNQGRPLNCPSGSSPYYGVCLTDEEIKQLIDKEESNFNYQEEKERKKQEEYNKNYKLYLQNNTKKGSKKNKLEPWKTFNKEQWEKRNMDNWYDNPNDPNISGSIDFYLDKKDIGDGNYEYNLYPKAVIENMMSMQGVRPVDFQKTSGLNAEKLQGEYNNYIEFLDSYYDYQGKELIDKYTKQGMSAEEVKQKLIKQGYADNTGFNKLFKDVAEGFDYKNNGDKFFIGEYDNVLYKTDKNNKVYEYNNDTWTLVKPTKEQEANFKNMSEKDRKIFSDQGTYMAGEKLMVNGKPAFFYNASLDDKEQNTVVNDYKKAVSDNKAEWEAANKQAEGSQIYSSYNNHLYNHVYGTDYSIGNLKKINPLEVPTTAEKISGTNIDSPHIGYTQAYNKVVDELNAVTKNKKSTDSFEDIRKKKAAILEKFINLAGSGDKDRGGYNQPSWGLLPEYNYSGTFGPSTFQTKDITAYKDKDKLASQLTFATDSEAQNYLYQAYENNILPNAYNAHTTNYKGTNLKEKYPTFQDFVQSPEAKSFLNTFIQSPDVGKTLFNNAYNFKEKNFITDQQNEELALGRKNLAKVNDWSDFTWENATSDYGLGALKLGLSGFSRVLDQGMSAITQPVSTLEHWFSGKPQDPLIGSYGDNPTEADLIRMDKTYGVGTSSAYLENINKINQSPLSQITNLFNPLYYAANAGRGIGRKNYGDPDQSYVDIGENLLFAFMGTKGGSKLMGAKPLSYAPKFIPSALKTSKFAKALNTSKVASRIGTAATNYGTFGNLLNAYFLKHAFVPSTDPETGETVQGFGTEAFKNIYKGLTDKDGINMDMISPNLVNAYMAYSIGKHGLHNANYLSGNLLGKPALIPRLPIQNRISEGLQKFKQIPKIVKDPKSGYLKFKYEDVQFNPTVKYENNNRKGENYHQRGGIVLPIARFGKEKKTGNERISERRRRRSEREIEKEVARSLENLDFTNYVNATAPETMTLIDNLKNNNASEANYVEPTVGEKPVLPAEFVPASNLNVENDFGFSALGAEQVPAIPKAPWELQDLPGRQLKSLMSNGKIFKITEPKTGLVNLNQALGIIGQEKGAPEKLAFTRQGLADFLQQGLDQPLPEKIDFNQLRRIVQEKIPAMETQIVDHNSHYGGYRLGYPNTSISANKEKLANTESEILTIKDNILKAQAEPREVDMGEEIKKQYPHLKEMNWPEIGYAAINRNGNIEYATTLVEAKRTQESALIYLNNQLKERMDRFDEVKKDMENLPLENKTLILRNTAQFGQLDIAAHGNPKSTLGHIHFLRDKETPDTATITQMQADPFQSTYNWRYNINYQTREIGNGIKSLKDQLDPTFGNRGPLSEEAIAEINNKIEELKKELEVIAKENTPNYEQKVLLEASHEQRFLQEFVDYAARRGDINKIRIPTLQTAANVQNYRPTSKKYIDPETRGIYETSNSWEEVVANHLKLHPEDVDVVAALNEAEIAEGKADFDSYKRDRGEYEPKYSSKNMTVLKKYIEQAENVRKLFGQDPRPVVDGKGNTWYEFDIPKSFKDLKGEIQAYKKGGSIQMDLTQDEINSYANGGWIVEDLDTYQGGGGGGGKGKARREARRASKITIKQDISKKLADLTFNNYLNETAPEQMSLITYLKNNNLISKTLPEGDLVTYPNLLNLATKKGIQNALTFSRSTAGTDFGISSSGTKTELSPRDLEAYKKFNLENDEVGKGLYAATHVPFMRYGQRTGLTNLPYKIEEIKVYKFGEGEADYVVANNLEQAQEAYKKEYGTDLESSAFTPSTIQQATNDSFDALYTYANNTGLPRSVKKGIFGDQYGKFTSILRYPFDYSGSANDMLSRFTDLERSTFSNAENLSRTAGREFPLPGSIGAFNFTDKPTLENSFLAPIFAFPETPVIGRPGQKLFDPVATYYKPELEGIYKDIKSANTLILNNKYDELINFLNDKIKAGEFGSIESNIQSIKDQIKKEVLPDMRTFAYEPMPGNKHADKLWMHEIINPETGLINTELKGEELENLANNAWQSYQHYMFNGPRRDAFYKTDNVKKIPYSPFRFKFKDGGELPKARFGKEIKTNKLFRKNNKEYFPGKYKFPDIEGRVVTTQSADKQKVYTDMWNKLLEKRANENPDGLFKTIFSDEPIVPKLDERTRDLLRYPEFDIFTGESSPELSTPADLQKNLENINFKVWSDNWNSLQELKNSMDGPQWVPTKDDYFSKLDFSSKIMDQMEYDLARLNFDYDNPESVNKSDIMRLEEDISRDELFSNLHPNVGLPNFRNKILSPEQQSYLEKFVGDTNPSVYQRGKLNPEELKKITTGFETLPKTYQEFVNLKNGNHWLFKKDPKDIVTENRKALGLSESDLQKVLSDSNYTNMFFGDFVKRYGNQLIKDFKFSTENPFTGIDAWGKITNETGYKNKFGGVSMKLSKDEINKYVNGGYIVTEE
jgi:hypothetical protein